ncbi:Uncharacterised protein [Candidatus Burarchaeum australiense]|nr:Uncharacterised protein [Candidatus Burarchaeum australiense]
MDGLCAAVVDAARQVQAARQAVDEHETAVEIGRVRLKRDEKSLTELLGTLTSEKEVGGQLRAEMGLAQKKQAQLEHELSELTCSAKEKLDKMRHLRSQKGSRKHESQKAAKARDKELDESVSVLYEELAAIRKEVASKRQELREVKRQTDLLMEAMAKLPEIFTSYYDRRIGELAPLEAAVEKRKTELDARNSGLLGAKLRVEACQQELDDAFRRFLLPASALPELLRDKRVAELLYRAEDIEASLKFTDMTAGSGRDSIMGNPRAFFDLCKNSFSLDEPKAKAVLDKMDDTYFRAKSAISDASNLSRGLREVIAQGAELKASADSLKLSASSALAEQAPLLAEQYAEVARKALAVFGDYGAFLTRDVQRVNTLGEVYDALLHSNSQPAGVM